MEQEGMEVAGEQKEDQALEQILALASSGNPQALPQIAEIVKGLLAHNQEEEQGMEGGEGAPQDMASRVMARIKQGQGAE